MSEKAPHDTEETGLEPAVDEELEVHPLEEEMTGYPLREAAEDPRWAIRVVKVWTGIAIGLMVGIFALIVLGIIYD